MARIVWHHKVDENGRELRRCCRCWEWKYYDEQGRCETCKDLIREPLLARDHLERLRAGGEHE